MYTPSSPSHGSPTQASRFRPPPRHADLSSSRGHTANGVRGDSPTRVGTAGSHGGSSHSYNNNDGGRSRMGTRDGRNGSGDYSYSSSSFPRGHKEERTIVGTGTIGSGAAWEAQQAAVLAQHLDAWNKNKRTQQSVEATRKEEKKYEQNKQAAIDRDKKRQMFLENRFTTVYFAAQQQQPIVNNEGEGAATTPSGTQPGGGIAAQQQPVVEFTPVVRNRSPAERRERNILPASATSPLRQQHYREVVKNKSEFVKQRQGWDEARQREKTEHENYIHSMHSNSSPTARSPLSDTNSSNSPYKRSVVAASDVPRPSSSYTNTGGNSIHNNTSTQLPRVGRPATSPPRERDSGIRSPSPTAFAEQCRREVLEMRAANEAAVEAQREADLIKNRELRHAVVTSHYNTYKAVKDLTATKNDLVNTLRGQSEARQQGAKELTKHIRDDKYTHQKSEREQRKSAASAAAYQRRKAAITSAQKETEAEKQRLEERDRSKAEELRALRASAGARRVRLGGSGTNNNSPSANSLVVGKRSPSPHATEDGGGKLSYYDA